MARGRKDGNSYGETNKVADYPQTDEVTDFRELSPTEKLEETATKWMVPGWTAPTTRN